MSGQVTEAGGGGGSASEVLFEETEVGFETDMSALLLLREQRKHLRHRQRLLLRQRQGGVGVRAAARHTR